MTIRRRAWRGTMAFAILAMIGQARAEVKLPAVLSDHMVLQQQMPVPIWGTAAPGEQVTVTFGDQKQSATADSSGKWKVALSPLHANAQPADLTVAGSNTIALHDILVGEVWVCSGQSNMEFAMRTVKNSKQEIEQSDNPQIRLFTVPKWIAEQPESDIKPGTRDGKWEACTPQTVPGFTAVGYFFGRDLQKSLRVPVGLIHTSWGGTPAESWTPDKYLKEDSDFDALEKHHETAQADYERKLEAWPQAVEQAKAANHTPPPKPRDPQHDPNLASVLYNGMIAPIVPDAIRGAIWYQGESNAGRAYQYRKLLPAMIKSWRDSWGEPDMSFLIVSLANYQDPPTAPGESDWAELREAQSMTAHLPHNGQALAIDLADANNPRDIHPKDKQDVGHRLAYVALAQTYGQNIPYSGPEFESMKVQGNKAELTFKFADGMKAKDGPLKGFQVAGEDHQWHWADAHVGGNTVIVSCPDVQTIAAVRYDWANNPQGNLYNKAGLPAVPFRTDQWPGVTEKNR